MLSVDIIGTESENLTLAEAQAPSGIHHAFETLRKRCSYLFCLLPGEGKFFRRGLGATRLYGLY